MGKTYLVKRFFNEKYDFFFTGSCQTTMKDQLVLFQRAMKEYTGKECPLPKNWFDAFSLLWDYLKGLRKKRLVVFLDELPWMDTPKSNFHSAFSYFWNTWASTRNGMKLIVCGSATTWMLDKIIGDKGGLYGRTNRTIYLAPFNLGEVELFLQRHKGINWNRRQIAEAYMIFGGIPYYLDMLERDLPLSRNVDNLLTNVCSWSCPPMTDADGTDWNGAQIDLLLCRGDETIHLCEMKYSSKEFAIDGSYEETLRTRLETFAHHTKTNNSLRTTMITTYGVKPNMYSSIMDDQVRLDDLFGVRETDT